jgi:hypothetical protein
MWWDGKDGYNASKQKRKTDVPYTGIDMDKEWGMEITQSLIAIHGFGLTKTGRLPKALQYECRANSDIWWPAPRKQSTKRKRIADT